MPVAVNRDGQLMSRVNQKVDTKQEATEGATPATHVRTEVEVPSQGIHRTIVSDSQQAIANVERRNNVCMISVKSRVLHTDMRLHACSTESHT